MLRPPGKRDRELRQEILEWIGSDFDPEQFDVDAVDKLLGSAFERAG